MLRLIYPLVLVTLFSLLGTGRVVAQENITDSLWKKFDHLPQDSSGVDVMIKDVIKLKQRLKNSPEEEKMLQRALALADRIKYKHGIAECYNLLGVYYRETSRYSDALSFHEKALEIGKETKDSVVMAYALNSLGVAYRRLDENQKAFQYHFEALNIAKARGDVKGRSIALNSIGNIYLSLGDYRNAIEEFEEGLQLESQMNSNIGQAINYANMGAAYEGMGDIEKAIVYYKESLKFNSMERSDKGIAICYNLLGEANLKKGDYDIALFYLRQAVALNDKLKDKINVAENDITIGKVYQKKEDFKTAIRYLNDGLAIAREIGSQSLIIEAYQALGETQNLSGASALAFASLKKAYELKDSLYKEQATPQMAKLRTLYELDKKEDQIRLLTQENEISQLKLANRTYLNIGIFILLGLFVGGTVFYLLYRKQKDKRLMLQYELQSLRSQMNPHFIFNALNSIDNFIWKKDPEQASAYLVKFSNLMRMTLQNSRARSIFFSVEVEFLKLYLELENFRHDEKFHYTIEVAPEIDGQNIMIPSMVIQPFVENAILHGLSHKTAGDCKLSVRFRKKDDLIICEVEDNGIGRKQSKQLQDKKFSGRQSLGIQVTEERVALLKKITGKKELQIKITDLENGDKEITGTKVRIILPVDPGMRRK